MKGAPGFSVLPSDYLVACARLSVSVDKRTNHANNEITNERKTAGIEKGRALLKATFQIRPLPQKPFLVSKSQN